MKIRVLRTSLIILGIGIMVLCWTAIAAYGDISNGGNGNGKIVVDLPASPNVEQLGTNTNTNNMNNMKSNTLANDDRRYILYGVNPAEGFNLRREVFVRVALTVAVMKGKWTVIISHPQTILPTMHK
jgi:hypothetical protein